MMEAWRARFTRVQGMTLSGDTLLVAIPDAVMSFPLLLGWSKRRHRHFPGRFREATRALLLCAGAGDQGEDGPPAIGAGNGVWCLRQRVASCWRLGSAPCA